jgi:hypothetical protein
LVEQGQVLFIPDLIQPVPSVGEDIIGFIIEKKRLIPVDHWFRKGYIRAKSHDLRAEVEIIETELSFVLDIDDLFFQNQDFICMETASANNEGKKD